MKAISDGMVEVERFEFPSMSGTVNISARVWSAAECGKPCGVVQIVHGMAEYVDRYDEFARLLANRGFVVCGHDHLGHGGSVNSKDEWGDLPARTGADVLVEDVHRLRCIMVERYGSGAGTDADAAAGAQRAEDSCGTGLPYFIFGHSMGSFIAREYAARHGEGLAGVIASGTADEPALKCKAGNAFARLVGKLRGNAYRSTFVHSIADGGYAKAIPNARTSLDWLSLDPAVVDEYIADEACGFMFSVGGYAALTQLTIWIADSRRVARIPDALPLLFVAGTVDPVGACGKGPKAVCERLVSSGKTAQLRLYDGMRHELLKGPGSDAVLADILEWLELRPAECAGAQARASSDRSDARTCAPDGTIR